jgi:hypothetical protein
MHSLTQLAGLDVRESPEGLGCLGRVGRVGCMECSTVRLRPPGDPVVARRVGPGIAGRAECARTFVSVRSPAM